MSKFLNIAGEPKIAYESGIGMWAFVLHRITGIGLIFYLLMHIMVISSSVSGRESFDKLLKTLTSPFFLALDLLLLAVVLFHSFNGARILLFDTGIGIRQQKSIFFALMAPVVIIWLATAYFTLPFILK